MTCQRPLAIPATTAHTSEPADDSIWGSSTIQPEPVLELAKDTGPDAQGDSI